MGPSVAKMYIFNIIFVKKKTSLYVSAAVWQYHCIAYHITELPYNFVIALLTVPASVRTGSLVYTSHKREGQYGFTHPEGCPEGRCGTERSGVDGDEETENWLCTLHSQSQTLAWCE